MLRTLLVGTLGLVLGFGVAFFPPVSAEAKSKMTDPCCKHCRKAKACGNECISLYDECHKPPGCACDAK